MHGIMDDLEKLPHSLTERRAFLSLPGRAQDRHRHGSGCLLETRGSISARRKFASLPSSASRCRNLRRLRQRFRASALQSLLVLLAFSLVPECRQGKEEFARWPGVPWLSEIGAVGARGSAVPEGISPSLSGSPFSSASPGSDHDVASVSKSSSPPVLPFSEDDLKTVARGFERHLHLYPAYIHGRSKKGSIVIYRRLPTEATKETYLPSRDLLIDGFLLQKAVEQACRAAQEEGGKEAGTCRFLLVIDLENIASFIRTALSPMGVASLHKQPQSQALSFVNSPQWQFLRSLFFIPAYCENVLVINAPPVVLQLLSVFDHFLFHPHRNPVTGRGHPESARLIQTAVAQNRGSRFLLQGSLDSSALLEAVDQSQLPVEYSESHDSDEGSRASLVDGRTHSLVGGLIPTTPETVSLFRSLFQVILQVEGSVESAKERNPTLASFALVKGAKNDFFASLHDRTAGASISPSSRSSRKDREGEKSDTGGKVTRKDPTSWVLQSKAVVADKLSQSVGDIRSPGRGVLEGQPTNLVVHAAEKKKAQEAGEKKVGAGGGGKRKRSDKLLASTTTPISRPAAKGRKTFPGSESSVSSEQQAALRTPSSVKVDGQKVSTGTPTGSVEESRDGSLETKKHSVSSRGGAARDVSTLPSGKRKKGRRSNAGRTTTATSATGTTTTTTTTSAAPSAPGPVPAASVRGTKRRGRRTKRLPGPLESQSEVFVGPLPTSPPPAAAVTTPPGSFPFFRDPTVSAGAAVAWGDQRFDAQEQQGGRGLSLPLGGIPGVSQGEERKDSRIREVEQLVDASALPGKQRLLDGVDVARKSPAAASLRDIDGPSSQHEAEAIFTGDRRSYIGHKEPAAVSEVYSREQSDKESQGFESATGAIEGSMFSMGAGLTAGQSTWGSVNFSGGGGAGLGWGASTAEGWGVGGTEAEDKKKKPDIGRGYYLDEEEALEVADDFDDI